MNNNEKIKKLTIIGSSVTGTAGFFSDVVQPLIPIASYLAGILFFSLLLSLIIYLSSSVRYSISKIPINEELKESISSYWEAPIISALFLSTIIMFTCSFISEKTEKDGGYSSIIFPIIKEIQSSLGIIRDIAKEAKQTNKNLETLISGKSTDPRVEIKNIGLQWSKDEYESAIERGDLRAIKLFLEGGMSVDSFGQSYSWIEMPLAKSKKGYEVMQLLLDSGLKKEKIDQKILISLSISLENCDLLNSLYKLGFDNPKPNDKSFFDSKKTFSSVCR